MSKVRNEDIVLTSDEKIIFPNSQISDTDSTAGLVISGTSSIDASKIGGIPVDGSNIGDQKALTYDQASGSLVYASQGGGGATVKNIQFVTITLGDGVGSNTAAITGVVMANTLLLWNGFREAGDVASGSIRVKLTNTTTVTASRQEGGSWAGIAIANVCVLEFDSGSIKGVQRGDITIAAASGSNTHTLTAVDTSKSILSYLGGTGTSTTNDINANIELTNSTTVTLTRTMTAGSLIGSFELLEFN